MYDAVSASETGPVTIKMQRARGCARVAFACSAGKTRLQDLYQSGSAKVRLPRVYDEPATAVLINTAGGLTDRDRLDYEVGIGPGAHEAGQECRSGSGGRRRGDRETVPGGQRQASAGGIPGGITGGYPVHRGR